MLAGGLATAVALLVSVTTVPAAGAGALSVTVPTELTPPNTRVGLSKRELTCAGPTTIVASAETPPTVPVMETDVLRSTAYVLMGNVAVFEAAGTVTVDGTLAIDGVELARDTTVPPDGAALSSVTVPVAL